MTSPSGDSPYRTFLVPAILLLVGVAWVSLSPAEEVLGQGIKIVYVHVACIWVGLFGFVGWALLGWTSALSERLSRRWHPWVRALGWMAVVWFGLGVGTSMIAAKINWGAIYWAEPRMKTAIFCWMAALAIHTVNLWVPSPRIEAALSGVPALMVVFLLWITPLVLHPRQPFMGKDTTPFFLAFLGTFAIALALAVWTTIWLARRKRADAS
ncbi:MAG: hypothetical protein EP343_15845 [Deltaproteobacteria bacterium]|nr:MAG: hypothetical protein EP343_15845 [Deltaproteobacteria bacterium]